MLDVRVEGLQEMVVFCCFGWWPVMCCRYRQNVSAATAAGCNECHVQSFEKELMAFCLSSWSATSARPETI